MSEADEPTANTQTADSGATSPTANETKATPKTAVLYLRVSTKAQVGTWVNDDGLSLSAQEDICRDTLPSWGPMLSRSTRRKGISAAASANATRWQMLSDIEGRQPVDYVIVYKLDRSLGTPLTTPDDR